MQNKELEAKIASLEKEMSTVKQDIATAQSERDKAVEDYKKSQQNILNCRMPRKI